MSPPIPLVMRIVILVDWRMEYFLCLIGPKNSHPKPNSMTIYFQFSLVQGRMRRPLIGARDFKTFIGQKEQAQGRSWRLSKEEDFFLGYMWKRKKEEEEV